MPARPLLATLLLAHLAACGGSSTPEPQLAVTEATGGSRLKARWYAAPEGPVRPHGTWNGPFHDTALGVDCGFVLAGDGAWRCLPFTTLLDPAGAYPQDYFGDDTCTSPLVLAAATCTYPAPTQIGLQTMTCPVLERRLAVGAAISADAPVFLRSSDGACTPFDPTATTRGSLHLVGTEIDYATFVAAERRDGTPRQGYAEASLVASDGAVQPLGFVASGSSDLLLPGLDVEGRSRLLPLGVTVIPGGDGYTDGTCSAPAVTIPGSCTSSPGFALVGESSADACEWRYRVLPLGASLSTLYGYSGSSGGCVPLGTPNRTAFVLGAELPASTFPLAPALSTSTVGRLTRSASGVAGTWRWGGDVIRDTQLDAEVAPAHASDGSLRWLPYGHQLDVATARYFSDFECTSPLVPLSTPLCPGTPQFAWLITDCRVGQEIRRLTPHADQVFERVGGFCVPGTSGTGGFFARGLPIPPDRFVPATIVLR